MRVALLSGGKDSLYAAMHYWPPDVGLVLLYKFPEPNPHLENLGKTVETITLTGTPVVVARLPKGREFEATVTVLEKLGAKEIVAGDVYIEDHLRYMEKLAGTVGARLREPLWGLDPGELLYKIVEAGIKALIIGARGGARRLIGMELSLATVDSLVAEARRGGWDPLGERGEYHTIVLESPVHAERLRFEVLGRVNIGSVGYLKLG